MSGGVLLEKLDVLSAAADGWRLINIHAELLSAV